MVCFHWLLCLSRYQPDQRLSAPDYTAQSVYRLYPCVYLGKIMEIIFSKKVTKSILIALSMTLIGFLCRYFLEYGEVSNTYNFTLHNIALHLLITGILILLSHFFASKIM